jgi:hypothetical protein
MSQLGLHPSERLPDQKNEWCHRQRGHDGHARGVYNRAVHLPSVLGDEPLGGPASSEHHHRRRDNVERRARFAGVPCRMPMCENLNQPAHIPISTHQGAWTCASSFITNEEDRPQESAPPVAGRIARGLAHRC